MIYDMTILMVILCGIAVIFGKTVNRQSFEVDRKYKLLLCPYNKFQMTDRFFNNTPCTLSNQPL